jgi:glutamine amidotransferase
MSNSISIIDYGIGNLRSVQKAFESFGVSAQLVTTADPIRSADKVVLPGVGAFKDCVDHLKESGLLDPVLDHIRSGKKFLGICVGMQMLFDVGYEDGEHKGLGILKGKVVRFDVDRTKGLKVPHMGWNQLDIKKPSPLLRDLPKGANAYFVHSYHCVPDDASIIATTTDYGGAFVSSVWKDNVMATQFHPEKSQKVGLQILANFASL